MDIPAQMEIDTLEAFDALVTPRRLELAEFFREPGTAKAAAERFQVPVTRLYYHINTLLEHDLLRVVSEQQKGGMTERWFQTAARSFRPSKRFLERYGTAGLLELIRLTFTDAELALRQAVEAGLVSLADRDTERVILGYSSMRLNEENLKRLISRINEIIENTPEDPDGMRIGGLLAIFPKAGD